MFWDQEKTPSICVIALWLSANVAGCSVGTDINTWFPVCITAWKRMLSKWKISPFPWFVGNRTKSL